MRRGLLMLVLLGAVLAGVLWWRRGSSSKKPSAGSVDAGELTREAPVVTHRGPVDARTLPVPPPLDASPNTPERLEELTQGIADAHTYLVDRIAPCFADHPVTDAAVIKFRYVMIAAGGTAHAADALVTEASEPIVERVECMTEAIGTASWPTQLPDLETPVEDQVAGAELR